MKIVARQMLAGLVLAVVIDRALVARVRPDALQMPRTESLHAAIIAAYAKWFRLKLSSPAVHDDPSNGGCRPPRHVTTTAYVERSGRRATLLRLSLSPEGAIVKHERKNVLSPAGVFKVLTVVIQYRETIDQSALTLWETAQHQINQQHAALATSRGLKRPLVAFENTNVLVPADPALLTPRNPSSVRAAAARVGQSAEAYDIVMAIDINPAESMGGLALTEERSIYVGNYSRWKSALTPEQWHKIAATAYHHEMAHHWGWDHDWALSCGSPRRPYDPFLAPPGLFGWDDTDGDGIVEILDETPYGSSASSQGPPH